MQVGSTKSWAAVIPWQEASRHGDLRAVEKALSAPADPNKAAGKVGAVFPRLHMSTRVGFAPATCTS